MDRFAMMRESAIQQEHELPEIIAETKIFKGNAERPPHGRSRIGLNSMHFQSIVRSTR